MKVAGYLDPKNSSYKSHSHILYVDGLSNEEIHEIQDFIEFLKNKKKGSVDYSYSIRKI